MLLWGKHGSTLKVFSTKHDEHIDRFWWSVIGASLNATVMVTLVHRYIYRQGSKTYVSPSNADGILTDVSEIVFANF